MDSWLADLVVVAHAAFVAFVVLGGLLVVRWPWLAWVHLPAAGWGVLVEWTGWLCPLTTIEQTLREAAGRPTWSGDFVGRYLLPVLYPEGLTREAQWVLGGLVVTINVAVYAVVLRRRGRAASPVRESRRRWSTPHVVTFCAFLVGAGVFVATAVTADREGLLQGVRRLGLALPLVLLPSAIWHLLRTLGWARSFPTDRPVGFWRLFRVRLAADAVAYFTVRGVTSEPLRVLLLYDDVAPEVTTAAVALERLVFAVVSTVVAGIASAWALAVLSLSPAWETVFRLVVALAVVLLVVVAIIVKGGGLYFAPLIRWLARLTRRPLMQRRAVRFITEVEAILLELARGGRQRLLTLVGLAVLCYGLMAVEALIVFAAIGAPISVTAGMVLETFGRVASIASAAIPASLGTLEASTVAMSAALGLEGGAALALTRRFRGLLWAITGLLCYPRLPLRAREANGELRELPDASVGSSTR